MVDQMNYILSLLRSDSLGCPEGCCSMHMGHLCCLDNRNFQMLGSQEGAHKEGSTENHLAGSED